MLAILLLDFLASKTVRNQCPVCIKSWSRWCSVITGQTKTLVSFKALMAFELFFTSHSIDLFPGGCIFIKEENMFQVSIKLTVVR